MGELEHRKRWLVAGAAVTLLAAAGGGALAATELGSASTQTDPIVSDAASRLGVTPSALESPLASGRAPLSGRFFGGFGRAPGFGDWGIGAGLGPAAESYLGLSGAQIRTELRAGKTLAQIAVAQGKTADGLIAALVAAAKAKLANAVSAGRLSSSQEATIESNLQSEITAIVNGTTARRGFGFGRGFRGGFGALLGADLGAAESYLGLSGAQIRTELRAGKTLAQIAVAQGKTADGLIAALVAAAKAKLANAVSAGRLSSSQEATIESNLQSEITAIVNGTTAHRSFGFHGPRWGGGASRSGMTATA